MTIIPKEYFKEEINIRLTQSEIDLIIDELERTSHNAFIFLGCDKIINKLRKEEIKQDKACMEFAKDSAWSNGFEEGLKQGKEKGKLEAFDINAVGLDLKLSKHYFQAGRKDALQIIDNWLKSYPEDVFLKISDEDFKKIHRLLMYIDIPLDRLSAHILRDALIKIKGEIENGKNKHQ